MNRADLINHVSTCTGLPKATAAKAVDAIEAKITEALTLREEVAIIGFGTFSTTSRPERMGRNPRTGAEVAVPASRVPKFKPGKTLKDAVKG